MSQKRVVMVTGASRGIGRATALALAARGHDLVLTARRLGGGAVFDGSSVNDPLKGVLLPGSVDEVAEACRDVQRAIRADARVLCVPLDLADESTVVAAADVALNAFGVIDTFVSNAIYQGPGINDRFGQVDFALLRTVIECDAVAPLLLLQRFLPGMLASGRGVFVHLTSGAATLTPRKPSGEGGWGVAYAMAKGAAHRVAGVLHAEHSGDGFRAYSLNPGHVTTDVMRMRAEMEGREVTGNGPDDVATAIDWLVAGSDDAVAMSGNEVVSRDIVKMLR